MGQTDLWHFLPPAVAGGPSLLWRLVALLTGRPSSSAPTGPAPAAFIVNKYTPLFPPAEVGGKAHNVIRLMTIPQIHTPATCVISCSEFDAQLPALAGLSEPAKATLMVFLQPATRYAVRSSADIEDAGDSAMAGMFLTVLNVEGSLEQIERAVVACWKSVQGEAVQRVEPRPRMAVVVMEQVDSEKAGVLFMANPVTKSVGSWVVTATYGQGEGVVGGTLPVDTYTLSADDKHVLRKSKLAHKTKQLLLKDGGTVEADVPAELQDGSALSEADIRALAAAGQAVRAHTSCPQDIEFAFAKGKLFILQTRPITTLGAHLKWEAPEPGLYQLNGHLATPLSRFYQPMWADGHPPGVMVLSEDFGGGFVEINTVILNGFAYFCMRQPGPRSAPKALPPPWLLRIILRLTAGKAIKQAREFWKTKKYRHFTTNVWPKRKQELVELHTAWQTRDLQVLTDAQLADMLSEAQKYGTDMYTEHVAVTMNNLSPVGWFVIRAKEMSGCTSVEGFSCVDGFSAPSLGLAGEFPAEFSLMAKDAQFCALLANPDAVAAIASMRQGDSPAHAACRKVLQQVEYRLADGYDCACGTLREEPRMLRAAFALAVKKQQSAEPDQARERGVRAGRTLRERVPAALQAEFDELLEDARFVASIRDERALYTDLWSMGIIHHVLFECGRRLAARAPEEKRDGSLALEGAREELQACLRDARAPAETFWAEMRARRHTRATASVLEAPPALGGVVLSPTKEYFPDEFQARSALTAIFAIDEIFKAPDFELEGMVQDDPDVIVGMAGAQGVSTGQVRIVNTADDAASVLPGEIVVTKYSSSVINLVLATAGGIVTDLGGVLCHAAICAREAELPCVVGCHSGTVRLQNGDVVEVDGGKGLVRIVSRH